MGPRARCVATIWLAIAAAAPAMARLEPEDLEYLGLFRLPVAAAADASRWGYGGRALTYLPRCGGGGADQLPGCLAGIGHAAEGLFTIVTIPRPRREREYRNLPVARVHRRFYDITQGIKDSQDWPVREVGGVEHVPPRAIAWTLLDWYNVSGEDLPSHGFSELGLSSPNARGPWHLGKPGDRVVHHARVADYLLLAPRRFARRHLGGRRLCSGFSRENGAFGGSQGPALFCVEERPPAIGPPGPIVPVTPLLYYPENGGHFAGYSACDGWSGAVWIGGRKGALVFVGRKGLGETFYGQPEDDPRENCSASKGYHCDPYESRFLFYDADELARVAAGELEPWEVLPYRSWKPPSFSGSCHGRLGGAALDRRRRLLYVVESDGERPVVHVWRLPPA